VEDGLRDDRGQAPGCVLCRAISGEAGADRLVVHQTELSFVVMNLFPYSGGHVHGGPRRHVGSLGEASLEELAEMMALARVWRRCSARSTGRTAINLGMTSAGPRAGVADHIHLHLVPRWAGDTTS